MNTEKTEQKITTRKGIETQKRRSGGVGMDFTKCFKKPLFKNLLKKYGGFYKQVRLEELTAKRCKKTFFGVHTIKRIKTNF